MLKLKNKKCIIVFLSAFILLNLYIGYSIINYNEKKDEIIRLHVVANSNNLNDLLLKFKVNEKINKFIASLHINNNLTSAQKIEILKQNSKNLLNIVNTTLKENNQDYKSAIKIGKINYTDSKDNELYHFSSGSYNSVQIILGDGNGKNIWGLISPNKKNIKKVEKLNTFFIAIDNLYKNSNPSSKKCNSYILEKIKNISK